MAAPDNARCADCVPRVRDEEVIPDNEVQVSLTEPGLHVRRGAHDQSLEVGVAKLQAAPHAPILSRDTSSHEE